ncbi:TadE/TadG family type IV pilus assembly protein [Arthrobacter sp. USHLN218]|uniref:TadE/TadG family type IV pilus assembly protein n=1 Tax=Arthrobacter sp. USHLN218 TaxID=3081232 RepID=UPI00301A37CB
MEFALAVPLLLLILLGILEFGRAYNTQISLTQAAREGVRVMAIEDDASLAEASTIQAAATLDPARMVIEIESRDPSLSGPVTVNECKPGHQATVRVTYNLQTLTGFIAPFSLTGQGVMRCGG